MTKRQAAGRQAWFVCVASRFNTPITQRLVEGARQALAQHGVPRSRIRVVWVPGAFELPVAAAWVAQALRPRGMIAVGCLIKGQTPQYAVLGQAVAGELARVSVRWQVPVGFGVIIAESFAQARARASGGVGNRGREAALAVLEMVALKAQL